MLILGLLFAASVANAVHVRGGSRAAEAAGNKTSMDNITESVESEPDMDSKLVIELRAAEDSLRNAKAERFKANYYLDSVLKEEQDPECVKAAKEFLSTHENATSEQAKEYLMTVERCAGHVEALPSGALAPASIMSGLKHSLEQMEHDLAGDGFKTDEPAVVWTPPTATVWGISPNHFVFRREISGNPGGWTQVRGRLIHVSQGSGWVWGLSMPNGIYRCKLPCDSGDWVKVPGSLIQLDVGTKEVWGVTMGHHIYKRSITGEGTWVSVPGRAKQISVGLGWIYAVTPGTSEVYKCKDPCAGVWVKEDAELPKDGAGKEQVMKQVDAGDGFVFGVTEEDDIFFRPTDDKGALLIDKGADPPSGADEPPKKEAPSGTDEPPKKEDRTRERPRTDKETSQTKVERWDQIPGKAKYVSSGNGYVWATSATNSVYKCKLPCRGEWVVVPGALDQVDCGQDVKIQPPEAEKAIQEESPGGPPSVAYVITSAHYIFKGPVDGTGPYKQVLGRLKHVTVAKEWIWGVTLPNSVYHCRRPCMGSWKLDKQAPKLTQVDAGENQVWGVDTMNFAYSKSVDGLGMWTQVSAPAKIKQVTVGNGWVWAVTTNDTILHCRLPCETASEWKKTPGNLMQMDAGLTEVYGWNSEHKFMVKRPIDGTGKFTVVRKPTDGGEIRYISVGDGYIWAASSKDVLSCKLPCNGQWVKVQMDQEGQEYIIQLDLGLPNKMTTPN